LVHFTSDASQELVIGDFTTAISVEDVEGDAGLIRMETNSEVMHSFLEFFFVESLIVVVIGDLEFFTNT